MLLSLKSTASGAKPPPVSADRYERKKPLTPPIRETVHIAAGWDQNKDYTLREAIEWYKSAMIDLKTLGPLTSMEMAYINKSWVELAFKMADREGVPSGSLAYYLAELANTEINLSEQANLDSETAGLT